MNEIHLTEPAYEKLREKLRRDLGLAKGAPEDLVIRDVDTFADIAERIHRVKQRLLALLEQESLSPERMRECRKLIDELSSTWPQETGGDEEPPA